MTAAPAVARPPAVAVTLHARATAWPPWRAGTGIPGDCSLAALVADLGVPHRALASAVLGGGLGWLRTWLNAQVPRCYACPDPELHLATLATGLPGPVVGMLTAVPVASYHRAVRGGATALATVGVGRALAAAGAPPQWHAPRPGTTTTRPCPPCVALTWPAVRRRDPGPGGGARVTERLPARSGHSPTGDRDGTATQPAARSSRHDHGIPAPEPGATARRSEPLPAVAAGHHLPPPDPDGPAGLAWAVGGSPAPTQAGTINLLVVTTVPLTDAGLVGALQTVVEAKAQALAAAGIRAANAPGFATGTATDAACVACPPGSRAPYAGPRTRHGADLAAAVFAAVSAGAAAARPLGRHLRPSGEPVPSTVESPPCPHGHGHDRLAGPRTPPQGEHTAATMGGSHDPRI